MLYVMEAALVFALLYVGYLAVAAHGTGYTWAQMDWNSSGHTSPAEYLRANGVGRRGIEQQYEIKLWPKEAGALQQSARSLKETLTKVKS